MKKPLVGLPPCGKGQKKHECLTPTLHHLSPSDSICFFGKPSFLFSFQTAG
jgi:hypothetical protein